MKIEDIYGELPLMETERLVLRKLTSEDARDIFIYASDPEVAKYVTWDAHQTLNESEEFLNFVLDQYKNKKISPWGIELKESGKIIGTVDFVTWNPKHKNAELGYVLSPEHWGKGITTEAVKELIRFGFQEMQLVRIQARCFTENIGSEKVMIKAGMTFEGIHKKAMLVKGIHRDLKMYAVVEE